MLVKYSCGCIGFAPEKDRNFVWIIAPCDGDQYSNEVSIFMRDQSGKDFTHLTHFEENRLLRKMGELIADGCDLRQIKSILK